jgi:hypothetical protein
MVAGFEEAPVLDTNVTVWVLDIASGQTKAVGRDEWMVPERTLDPVWSPDSKWVAYAGRLRSLHHAIFVSNIETGESKQVTDGLADAVGACVGCERQVSLVPRLYEFRPRIAMARHDVVRARTDVRPVLRDPEKGRAHAAACPNPTKTRACRRAAAARLVAAVVGEADEAAVTRPGRSGGGAAGAGSGPAQRDRTDRFDDFGHRILAVPGVRFAPTRD